MKHMKTALVTLMFCLCIENSSAVEFEKMGQAIAKALGTTKAFKSTVEVQGEAATVYYSKGRGGQPERVAVVQKGIYEPNCTHTWVVGLDARSAKVEGIRVVEMSCPHAFPTKKSTFLSQYVGRGPASVKKLSGEVHTVAKATGSSELTTTAVKKAILATKQFAKGF
ncbi:MAG: hypothetical protein KDD51_05600 [Bdellovibrionales bacterium]|nr:hypothetical protein [Bdellovibrionales bacterium]